MSKVQMDLMSEQKPWFSEQVQRRMRAQENFGTVDVAALFGVSESTVREWIEEGRLAGADLNAGRRTETGEAMRPYWRVAREAIIALAKRMEAGV